MHPLFAFGLPHGTDFFWIFLVVIVLFGANKIPQLAKGLGKSLGEFKRAKEDFEKELHSVSSTAGTEAKALENNPVGKTPAGTVSSTDELSKKI